MPPEPDGSDRLAVGILISGRGSNMEAIIKAAGAPGFPARVACVISSRVAAPGLEIARASGIPALAVSQRDYQTREEFDLTIDEKLRGFGVELVCLAGFMRILTSGFIDRWRDRILNVHPSLLPAFRGLHTHERALQSGCKLHGCTVHFVRDELDEGPIIIQAAVPVLDGDDEQALARRVLTQEHRIYPTAIRWIAEGRTTIKGMRVVVDGADYLQGEVPTLLSSRTSDSTSPR